ncbi:MAG: sodium ion-translocating decarboxylase subunit beta [Clostridiaceae bacterium]|nr:sodium ion-translocating decarboxylase subunit beta [Clostridiaceae bacterium]
MKKEKSIKVRLVTIFTVICALVTFISAFSKPLLSLYLSYRFNIDTRDAGSAGVIGGADGPTAVFISGGHYFYLLTVIFALLTVSGVIYLVVVKRKNKHS